VPSSFQYPVERHRDLQRRWGRLFQRTVPDDNSRLLSSAARSEHLRQLAHECAMKAAAANNPLTKARLVQERKQLLTLAEQAVGF
jgi:hypothetical protein